MDRQAGGKPRFHNRLAPRDAYKARKPPQKFMPDKAVTEADLAYYTSVGFDEIAGFACYLGEDYEALHGEVKTFNFLIIQKTHPFGCVKYSITD